jgi:hypothetical protein
MPEELTAEESGLLVQGFAAIDAGTTGKAAGATAKKMRANVFETDTTLKLPVADAVKRVRSLLAELGAPIDEESTGNGQRLRAMVGAGSMNMNPTVVTVTLTDAGAATTARIRGVAKEGLIKQRAGQKAAERVAGLLQA